MAGVDRALLTHYDVDHVGGLATLDPAVPAHAGEEDAAVLRGEAKPPSTSQKGLPQRAMAPLVGRPTVPIHPVADGEAMGSVTAHRTPGHTPGNVVYVSERLGVALLGDLVPKRRGTLAPPPGC